MAIVGMIVAIAYNPSFAMMVTFGLSILTCITLGTQIPHFLVVMGGTAAAVLTLERSPHPHQAHQGRRDGRGDLLPHHLGDRACGRTSRSTWFATTASGAPAGGSWPASCSAEACRSSRTRSGSSPASACSSSATTPIRCFRSLSAGRPARTTTRSPSGRLPKSAAERIGADGLLVRIGAYFHDIGKMLKPHYFVENQIGPTNRHAKLAPAMSTLIIIGHVKDGVDLGRQHHLPEPIIDLIEQHHGTTLVEYFYHEANRRNGNNPDASPVPESSYRYPGPKPQTREAAILMVADAVESASRTLSDPAPARLEGLVSDLVDKRLRDGQFDECGLTLREIAEIRESLIKSLIGIYHGRVKYPEHRTA